MPLSLSRGGWLAARTIARTRYKGGPGKQTPGINSARRTRHRPKSPACKVPTDVFGVHGPPFTRHNVQHASNATTQRAAVVEPPSGGTPRASRPTQSGAYRGSLLPPAKGLSTATGLPPGHTLNPLVGARLTLHPGMLDTAQRHHLQCGRSLRGTPPRAPAVFCLIPSVAVMPVAEDPLYPVCIREFHGSKFFHH